MKLDDATAVVKQFRYIVSVAILVLSFGTVFYHFTEHWKWLDSLYFCVVSLTTVGYGDIVPTTDAGKLFTVFYLIIGIGIIAALANNLIKAAVARRTIRKQD